MVNRFTKLPKWLSVLIVVVLMAVGFVVAAVIEAPTHQVWRSWDTAIRAGATFASCGGIFGTAIALDGRSGIGDYPIWRASICAVLGFVIFLSLWFGPHENIYLWAFVSSSFGALLGWGGYGWVRLIVEHG